MPLGLQLGTQMLGEVVGVRNPSTVFHVGVDLGHFSSARDTCDRRSPSENRQKCSGCYRWGNIPAGGH